MGCGISSPAGTVALFRSPTKLSLLKGQLMKGMKDSMTLPGTDPMQDVTYKEVQAFMVPAKHGGTFKNAPGTFDPGMTPRKIDKNFPLVMNRKMMTGQNEKGITWEKFLEHRGYASPGYETKAPQPGDVVPDSKILSLDANGPESTLLTEARKLAEAAGSKKVILAFDAVTCPFFRLYAGQEFAQAAIKAGVPTLHVYIREAEPCDVFDAGGMHCSTPLELRRYVPSHKSESDRRMVASETKRFLEDFYGKGNVNMWIDAMDDKLEALYEARPWRQYVIEAATGKMIAATGLAPFNPKGKVKKLEAALAPN